MCRCGGGGSGVRAENPWARHRGDRRGARMALLRRAAQLLLQQGSPRPRYQTPVRRHLRPDWREGAARAVLCRDESQEHDQSVLPRLGLAVFFSVSTLNESIAVSCIFYFFAQLRKQGVDITTLNTIFGLLYLARLCSPCAKNRLWLFKLLWIIIASMIFTRLMKCLRDQWVTLRTRGHEFTLPFIRYDFSNNNFCPSFV